MIFLDRLGLYVLRVFYVDVLCIRGCGVWMCYFMLSIFSRMWSRLERHKFLRSTLCTLLLLLRFVVVVVSEVYGLFRGKRETKKEANARAFVIMWLVTPKGYCAY